MSVTRGAFGAKTSRYRSGERTGSLGQCATYLLP